MGPKQSEAGGPWSVLAALRWTSERFAKEGGASPRLDAEVLLAHCLGVERVRLYVDFDKPLQPAELAAYREAIKRRLAGEPVAYITGRKEFWSLPLLVSPAVMIPRPETELLVEVALGLSRGLDPLTIVDVGTGSGAVALALKKELPSARVVACDQEPAALEVASRNAALLGLEVELLQGDLLDAVPSGVPLGLVVSNPPYVARSELEQLDAAVRREPVAALDGGPDGLELIRRLIGQATQRLVPAGVLALEIGCDQAARVAEILRDHGLTETAVHRDLAGLDRVVSARASGPHA